MVSEMGSITLRCAFGARSLSPESLKGHTLVLYTTGKIVGDKIEKVPQSAITATITEVRLSRDGQDCVSCDIEVVEGASPFQVPFLYYNGDRRWCDGDPDMYKWVLYERERTFENGIVVHLSLCI